MQLRILALVFAAALAACGGDSTGPDRLEPVATLSIADLPDTLLTRQSFRLTASAVDDEGGTLPDRPLTWGSSDPAVISITAGGMLTAVAPGVATVSVHTGTAADSATVVVRELAFAHLIAGGTRSCGLEASGEVWCWGNNVAPQYAGGYVIEGLSPLPERVAVGRRFSTLAMAFTSTCGLELSQTVACWGAGDGGQLGQGSSDSDTPLTVPGVANVVQLVAGVRHYCVRTDAGLVYCWGSNESKQTALPERSGSTPPHQVTLPGPATDLAAGDYHTCALVAGVGYCWGADDSQQLGTDTTYDRLVPVLAATGDGVQRMWTDVQAVALNTCARDQSGAMFCWGRIESGNDNVTTEWLPTRHFPGVTTAAIADGWFTRCVVGTQGAAWCSSDPAGPEGQVAPSGVQSVIVSGGTPCLLDASGGISCQFLTFPADSFAPVALPEPALRVAASAGRACALGASHAVYCWPTAPDLSPDPPLPVQWFADHPASSLFADGDDRICIIAIDNTVWCRDVSQVATESVEPTGGQVFDSLAIGQNHTCGLTSAGTVWCWGKNDHGQLGDGTTTDRAAPVQVQGGHTFVQIASGWNHTCGRTAAGELWCWGYGSTGQMADDHRDESATPVTVDGLPPLSEIAESCGLSSGTAWCWPAPGTFPEHQIAGATGLVTLGGLCGLRPTGAMVCWGSNYYGVFGNGTFGNTYSAAVAAGNGILFKEISLAAHATACGIGLDGGTYCWGSGYGTVPVKLVGSP